MRNAYSAVNLKNAQRIGEGGYRAAREASGAVMLTVEDRERALRLRRARVAAGYETASQAGDALRRFGAPKRGTYLSWENGNRPLPPKWFSLICDRFRINLRWLESGEGPMEGVARRLARIEGNMIAQAEIINKEVEDAEDFVSLPEYATEQWVGYRVSGDANSPVFMSGDVLFVRPGDRQDPEALINKLCIVTTSDNRRWVRTLLRGARAGLFTLLAMNNTMMPDVEVTSATPIRSILKA